MQMKEQVEKEMVEKEMVEKEMVEKEMVEKEMVEKEMVEKEMVQKLGGMELRSRYYVPPGQPNSIMIQLDHPGDVCAGGNSLYICDQI